MLSVTYLTTDGQERTHPFASWWDVAVFALRQLTATQLGVLKRDTVGRLQNEARGIAPTGVPGQNAVVKVN